MKVPIYSPAISKVTVIAGIDPRSHVLNCKIGYRLKAHLTFNARVLWIWISVFCFLVSAPALAQTPEELFRKIETLDSIVFTAFNTCDIETFGTMFTHDLEFYHDKGGLTDYTHTINAIKGNCERKLGLTRTLIPGSMEVYPIGDYGAVQIASHRFCHMENGKEDCGTFKLLHVWKNDAGKWKISRVVSYDH